MANQLAKTLDWPVYHFKSRGRDKILAKYMNPYKRSQRIVTTSSLAYGLDVPNIRVVFNIGRPYRLYQYS